jgi:ubiquitin carboxyl-terminal hydrolase 4/11/15
MTDADNKSDSDASLEAWTKHLVRNESIIVDLFHGQYKSTLVCSICSKVSVTFDPFMTLSLPIPGKKKKYSFFFIKYDIIEGYTNYSGSVNLRESETISDFRREVATKFNVPEGSFVVSVVSDNVFKKFLDQNSKVEELTNSEGVILLYEIPSRLNPALPQKEISNKVDSNYCISDEWTKSVVYMVAPVRSQYSSFM